MKRKVYISYDLMGVPEIHYVPIEGATEYVTTEYAEQLKKLAKADLLDWAMRLCWTGQTPSMIRKQLWNRWQEVTGNIEEKA